MVVKLKKESVSEIYNNGMNSSKEYEVLGISIYENRSMYILLNDNGERVIIEDEHFDIISSILPSKWYFGTFIEKGKHEIRIGYKEFVSNYSELGNLYEKKGLNR